MSSAELEPVRIAITAHRDEVERRHVMTVLAEWYGRHGRIPTQREWDGRSDAPMSARTVRRRWGWKEMLRQVLEDREPHAGQPGLGWSDREMLEALLRHRRRTGTWPSRREWTQATDEHASSRTYVRRFGRWPAAIEVARVVSETS